MTEPFVGQQAPQPPRRNPGLTDAELNAVSYFAIGVGSEGSIGGRDVSNKLSFAGNISNGRMDPVGNSGLSIGTLQTDLGQHPEVARTLVGAYQDWARANHPNWVLNATQQTQTTNDLSRNGETIVAQSGRSLDPTVKSHLDEFLKSEDGIRYVHNNDTTQANKLMRDVYTPLRETALYQNATADDQVKLAAIVGKAYNQSEVWGGRILDRVENGTYRSVADVSNGVGGLIRANGDYMETGRNDAVQGTGVLNALRNSNPQNPLHDTWQNVLAASPLTDPTRLNQDAARPNLPHEYATVKDLFLQKGEAPAFIQALNRGTTSMHGQQTNNGRGFVDDGLYAAGNDLVVWDRNGAGHALTNGTWSDVNRGNLGRTQNADGTVDLTVNRGGTQVPLLHADPRALPSRAEAPGETQTQTAAAQVSPQAGSTAATPAGATSANSPASQPNTDASSVPPTIELQARAIEKWSPEQQKVFESVKDKVQGLGVPEEHAQQIAAHSVAEFTKRKDKNPDERVDHVHAANVNGEVVVRTAYMKYGDKEPVFTNDARLKDSPPFEQSAAQIAQSNRPPEAKSAAEQNIANHQQNQDINQVREANPVRTAEDQIMARVQSSMPAISR